MRHLLATTGRIPHISETASTSTRRDSDHPTAPGSVGRLVFVRFDRTRSPAREASTFRFSLILATLGWCEGVGPDGVVRRCRGTIALPAGGPPTVDNPRRERVPELTWTDNGEGS